MNCHSILSFSFFFWKGGVENTFLILVQSNLLVCISMKDFFCRLWRKIKILVNQWVRSMGPSICLDFLVRLAIMCFTFNLISLNITASSVTYGWLRVVPFSIIMERGMTRNQLWVSEDDITVMKLFSIKVHL